jgi:alpha,alpha-trehalase
MSDTMPQSAAAPSPFPPIADYAFLSDCHTGALVAPDGAIDWLCLPSFDSPSVFGTLLDRQAGYFRLGPFGINHPTSRAYVPGTNVLETTWKTPSGWVLVRDALTMGPRTTDDVVTPHTRPPADDDADHLLVRTVRCLSGTVELDLVCEPAFDYGRTTADWTLVDERHAADATADGQTMRLRTDLALGVEGNRVRARHVLSAGEECFCALSWADGLAAPADVDEANARIEATVRFWRAWLGRARMPDHRWRDPIQRSALAIKGLTYMPTGATVAALTTSLPETPGGERNWDYRYTWMRDSTFTLQALHFLNLDWEADEFMQFVADLEPTESGALQIMYGIDGRRDLTESTRDDLSGYAGARRRGPGLGPAPHPPQPTPPATAVADRPVTGPVCHRGVARARPGDLGGPRRTAALRVVEADGLGRAGPGVEARGDPGRRGAHRDVAEDRRRDQGRHPGERRGRPRRPAPALRDGRARRIDAAGGALRLPPRHRRAAARQRASDRRRAH